VWKLEEGASTKVLKPSPKMKRLYWTYYLLVAIPCLLALLLPAVIVISFVGAGPLTTTITLFVVLSPFILATLITAYWIGAYYDRAKFVFAENEIVVERGVLWRRKSVVPYNRITNVGVVQGPISRLFGLATVRIHTAGYHAVAGGAGGVPVAEAEIFHVEGADKIADEVMSRVRELSPVAVEAGPELGRPARGLLADMLAELKRIRELLEARGA